MSQNETYEYTESLLYNREADQLRKRIAQLEKKLYRTTQILDDTRREQERMLKETVLVPQYEDVAPISRLEIATPPPILAPQTPTSSTAGEPQFDPDAPGAFLAQQYLESQDLWVASYPDSGYFSSGIGLNTFDFTSGRVRLYNGVIDTMIGNLLMFRARYMGGLYLYADQDCDVRFSANGRQTARIQYDQCADWGDFDIDFDRLELRFTYPGNFQLCAMTKSSQIIAITKGRPRMFRFSSGTTTDTFTPINWQATSETGRRSQSGAGFTNNTLKVPSILTKTFHVFNLSTTNSLDVAFQGKVDIDSNNFTFDISSGASTSIAANASKQLTSTVGYNFMQLLIRSTVKSSPATYEVQMMGTA